MRFPIHCSWSTLCAFVVSMYSETELSNIPVYGSDACYMHISHQMV